MRHLSLHARGCRQDATRKLMADGKEEDKKHKDECAYPVLYMHGTYAQAQGEDETTHRRVGLGKQGSSTSAPFSKTCAASPASSCRSPLQHSRAAMPVAWTCYYAPFILTNYVPRGRGNERRLLAHAVRTLLPCLDMGGIAMQSCAFKASGCVDKA